MDVLSALKENVHLMITESKETGVEMSSLIDTYLIPTLDEKKSRLSFLLLFF